MSPIIGLVLRAISHKAVEETGDQIISRIANNRPKPVAFSRNKTITMGSVYLSVGLIITGYLADTGKIGPEAAEAITAIFALFS